MCRRIFSFDAIASSLVSYYNFDENNGNYVFDKGRFPVSGFLNNNQTRVVSGAAIGDVSASDYTNTIKTASIQHDSGESFTVTSTSGNPTGLQLYMVKEQPTVLTGTSGVGNNDKYVGVFQVEGTSPQYTAVYNYNGNPLVEESNESGLLLFKRNDNAATTWINSAATLNTSDNTLAVTGQSSEYMLGNFFVTGSYRSVASGNWNDPATWEIFDGTDFVPATIAPSSSDETIAIRTGHNVTITAAVTTDQTIVETGGTLTQNEMLSLANGAGNDLIVKGIWQFNAGSIEGPGSVKIAENGTFSIVSSNNKLMAGTNITNNGTMTWIDGNIGFGTLPSSITNNNDFIISGNNQMVNVGSTGVLLNNGSITKTSNGATNFDCISAFSNTATGIISGIGTYYIPGSLSNNGIIAPGNSPGILNFNGSEPLSGNSTLQIEIKGGEGAGTGHGQLQRNSNLTLAGTLTVTETGTVPNGSYTIINLTAGTITGSFATVNLPVQYTLQVNSTSVVLIKGATCVNPPPTISASGSLIFCNGSSLTLTSTAAAGYLWNTGETTQSITVTQSGSYTVSAIDASGCTSNPSISVDVTVVPSPPTPTITTNGPTEFCEGGSVVLTSSASPSNIWSWGNISPITQSVTINGNGNFSVQVYNAYGCASAASDPITVIVHSRPGVTPISNQTVFNSSNTAAINFLGGATSYSWTNDNTSIGLAATGTGDIPTFVAINAGNTTAISTITVTPVSVENGFTCTGNPETFTINVYPASILNNLPDLIYCHQSITDEIQFTGNVPLSSVTWTNSRTSIGLAASGTGPIPVFQIQNNIGTIPIFATIIVTPHILTANGTSIDGPNSIFTIQVNPLPTMNSINDVRFCQGTSTNEITFSGTASSYQWQNFEPAIGLAANGIGNIPSFMPSQNNIPYDAFIRVRNFTNDGILCEGLMKDFHIRLSLTPLMNNVPGKNFCNGNIGIVNFSGINTTLYNWTNDNTNIGLDASGTGNIVFQAANIGLTPIIANIVVTPVSMLDGVSCSGLPEIFTITVNPTPSFNVVVNQRFCTGQTTSDINFSGNVPGTIYSWTNTNTSIGLAANGTGNIPSFVAMNNGSSSESADVTVSLSANGCSGLSRIFNIIVDPVPVVDGITNQVYCNNSTTNFTNFTSNISGAAGFTWTNDNPAIGLAASGEFFIQSFSATNPGTTAITATITVIQTVGSCTGVPVTFTITVNPSPTVNSIRDTTFCNGSTTGIINFTGNQPDNLYNWTNNDTSIGRLQ